MTDIWSCAVRPDMTYIPLMLTRGEIWHSLSLLHLSHQPTGFKLVKIVGGKLEGVRAA